MQTASSAQIENSVKYQAMLVAAAGKPERSMGQAIIAAEDPDWSEVRALATSLLAESSHIMCFVNLVKSGTQIDGFQGFASSLETLYEHLHDSWDAVLPLADAEEVEDPFYERVNYLKEVTEDTGFAKHLRDVALVDVRGIGTFSTRDIDVAYSVVPSTEEDSERCREGIIRGAFENTDPEDLESTHNALNQIVDLCSRIQELFDERAGAEHSLTTADIKGTVKHCLERFHLFAASRLPENNQDQSLEAGGTDGLSQENPDTLTDGAANDNSRAGSITDRTEARLALENIALFYRLNEPSSPMADFANRAVSMLDRPFFCLLEELVPSGKGDISALVPMLKDNLSALLLTDCYQRFVADKGQEPSHKENNLCSTSQTPVSRSEIDELLICLERYFAQNEPSSPVGLLLGEMRKISRMGFAELIDEFTSSLAHTT